MKIVIGVVAAFAVLIGVFMLVSEPNTDTETADQVQASTEAVTISTINNDVKNGSAFLDVRTSEEYAAGYFEGADNFPLSNLQQGSYPDVDKDSKVYIYCRSGNRSAEAKSLLTSAGYSNVVDLSGLSDVESIGGVLVN